MQDLPFKYSDLKVIDVWKEEKKSINTECDTSYCTVLTSFTSDNDRNVRNSGPKCFVFALSLFTI